ncbi:MAG: ABC transporter permease subunit, partial [Candidatus Bipolaricaulaceae bacterium]
MEEALLRAVLFGTPILLATLGALLAERSGVVQLGVEGMMALSALAAFAAALAFGPSMGILAGVLVGAFLGLFHGIFTVTLRANQFVAGLALSALGLGASGLLGKRYEGLPLPAPLPEG